MNVIKEEDKNVSTVGALSLLSLSLSLLLSHLLSPIISLPSSHSPVLLRPQQARFTAAQREFAKAKRADKLANFIASRPSRNTLEQRSIIIDEADKRSALNEARRALGTLMVNRPRPEMLKESNVLPDIGDLPVDDSLGERGNISVPTCVDSIDTPISKCGLGFNSSMLLDTHGHVYVFGSSSNGRYVSRELDILLSPSLSLTLSLPFPLFFLSTFSLLLSLCLSLSLS